MIAKTRKIVCITVNEADYADAVDSYLGWCPNFQSFTRDCTEPDAERYDCPECDGHRVVGAEQALLLGWIVF